MSASDPRLVEYIEFPKCVALDCTVSHLRSSLSESTQLAVSRNDGHLHGRRLSVIYGASWPALYVLGRVSPIPHLFLPIGYECVLDPQIGFSRGVIIEGHGSQGGHRFGAVPTTRGHPIGQGVVPGFCPFLHSRAATSTLPLSHVRESNTIHSHMCDLLACPGSPFRPFPLVVPVEWGFQSGWVPLPWPGRFHNSEVMQPTHLLR